MNTAELKNRIQSFVDKADDRVLSIVNSVFEHYYQDETVAYHPDGSPMTRKEYKTALDPLLAQGCVLCPIIVAIPIKKSCGFVCHK